MIRHMALAAVLIFSIPLAALAEPAVIARFEVVARAEPAVTAAAVQTLVEGTSVSVSEEAQSGWRRVRLADGRVGWIEEHDLTFPVATPSAPVVVSTASPSGSNAAVMAPGMARAPDLRATIYVKDVDHLAELVKSDQAVGPMADRLATRRTAGWVVIGVGWASALGYYVYSANSGAQNRDPYAMKSDGEMKGIGVGVGVAMVSTLVGILIFPGERDLLDVINTWNTRHPDQPFTIHDRQLAH
jgi:SH3-like domain-containing protein